MRPIVGNLRAGNDFHLVGLAIYPKSSATPVHLVNSAFARELNVFLINTGHVKGEMHLVGMARKQLWLLRCPILLLLLLPPHQWIQS